MIELLATADNSSEDLAFGWWDGTRASSRRRPSCRTPFGPGRVRGLASQRLGRDAARRVLGKDRVEFSADALARAGPIRTPRCPDHHQSGEIASDVLGCGSNVNGEIEIRSTSSSP